MPAKPIVLIILDGFGHRAEVSANAIKAAKTPVWDRLWRDCPHALLSASGEDVGLPAGQMGNSEVGHLTMGAGRVVYQDLSLISNAIQTGLFDQNPVFNQAIDQAISHQGTIHILGLLSPGGVHSHEAQIFALIKLAALKGAKELVIHAFLDGRDVPPKSAKASLQSLEKLCETLTTEHPGISFRIGSISGRYYAMDRDKRFERTELVYNLLTEGRAAYAASTALQALEAAYERQESDEFVKPTKIEPYTPIRDGDTIIFMNFRADRARQLCLAFLDPQFAFFKRKIIPKIAGFVTLTEYAKALQASVAFPPQHLQNMVGALLEKNHLKQLRIAETEKYAHVTFFFNGGREEPFLGEERILIPSPKVRTYDLAPEMSAKALTDKLVAAILGQTYDVIICNYANADMLGHTGNFAATVKSIEALDEALGRVQEALNQVNGAALITADHGNAELMFDSKTQQPHTAHTLEKVPFLYLGKQPVILTKSLGTLSDIAPTLLYLLGLPLPKEMTGTSLLK